jgi:hypothetical protein
MRHAQREEGFLQDFDEETKRKRQLGTPWLRSNDYIKLNFKEIRWEGVD